MHRYPPEQVVEILRSARADPESPELSDVLSCFRNRWLQWARHRYPRLEAQHEDAAQEAQLLVLERIDQLRDPQRVQPWANAVFLSVLLEIFKKDRRRARWRVWFLSDPDNPHDPISRFADVGLTPEERAILHERLEIVRKVTRACAVASLKFAEELSEKEIEERTGLSRDNIASLLKRFRRVLRRILDETDEEGGPLPTSKILERTGLPRDLQAKLSQVLERLRGPKNGTLDEDEEKDDG